MKVTRSQQRQRKAAQSMPSELYLTLRSPLQAMNQSACPVTQISIAHEFRDSGSVHLLRQSALCFGIFEFAEQSIRKAQHPFKGAVLPGANCNEQFLFRAG